MVQYESASVGASYRQFLMPDERGSIVGLIANDGISIAKNTYDEYGIPGTANQGRFQYTGQIWLPELGMYYYKARIYSPTLGRFLQVDPIGYEGGIALYAYVGNDPVNATDPSGLYECLGPAAQCKAVATSYQRALDALKGDKVTKAERAKLQSTVQALGAPGTKNGVTVSFASQQAIFNRVGRPALGYTEKQKDGTIGVKLRSDFNKLYENIQGKSLAGRDYGRVSAQDERTGILVHEGRHVFQFKNGLTQEQYDRNYRPYENDAYNTGKLINKAFGSESIYDVDD